MELLIVRCGEPLTTTGISYTHDGRLSETGLKQATATSAWLNYQFRTSGYVGFCSPYIASLQTASVLSSTIGTGFSVENRIRDFKFTATGDVKVENRSLLFSNLNWPLNEWTEDSITFNDESIEEVLVRLSGFIYNLNEQGHKKVIVITHATPAFLLAELALGKGIPEIALKCVEVVKMLQSKKIAEGTISMDKHPMIGGIKPCGLTWIKDSEMLWFTKTVY